MTIKPLILIVDDIPENIWMLEESLMADYRIKIALSGKAAFDMMDKHGLPDLILLDVMMPDMDGYEVCNRLKQDPVTSGIPVIFVTALNETDDEERGLKLGAADYITKPFNLPIAKARIKNHINFKLMTDTLKSMAWLDGLTGIPNRRRFDEVMEAEWKRAQRTGTQLSVILVDVDHFKDFNDHYGHIAGDSCLKMVASTLASSVTRAGDLVARFGGEEFALLTPGTSTDGVRLLAERLRSNIEKQHILHECSSASSWVTISAGYASVIPSKNGSPSMLLEEADQMLYCAKKLGRNRVHGSASG
jgi:diguanylate cyclase (GGDEF)-like protein